MLCRALCRICLSWDSNHPSNDNGAATMKMTGLLLFFAALSIFPLHSLPLSILNSGASHFHPSSPRGGRRPSAPRRRAMCGALKTRRGCLRATMSRRGRSGRLVAHDGRHRQTADAADVVAVSGRGQRLVLGRRRHPHRQAAGAVADVLADVSITDRKLRRNSTKRFPTLGRDLQPKTS